MYPVIGEPPEESGASQLIVAPPLVVVAVTLSGGLGIAVGVTVDVGDEAGLSPLVLVATTVNV